MEQVRTPLNAAQLDFLQLLEHIKTVEELEELSQVVSDFYARKAEEGMILAYFREDGSVHVMPRGLKLEGMYQIWNRDKEAETMREMSGAEIMGGLTIESKAATAVVMQYHLK